MESLLSILLDITEQGLLYAPLALAVFISYRVLHFPDISVDGTLPLGAAVTAITLSQGFAPGWSLLLAFLAGSLAGAFTGFCHVQFRINPLFSGLITMTVLYSVNLMLVGTSNAPLYNYPSIFSGPLAGYLPKFSQRLDFSTVLIACFLVIAVKLLLDYFFQTKTGLLLRATGNNQQLVRSLAVNPGLLKILGLSLANGLASFSGSIICQEQAFFEVSMGQGSMTTGLASVIIGSMLFTKLGVARATTQVVLGSLVYKALIAIAINVGAPAYMLNLVQGIIFLLILLSTDWQGKRGEQNAGT